MVDISGQARRVIGESGLRNGILCLFVQGSTGALTTIEYEEGLLEDFHALWDRLIPEDKDYKHNLKWNDGNGHSHVRASLLGPSLTVPFKDGTLTLGTWQQIIFVDFDNRPRQRQIIAQIMGE
ncbi:MAG: secondary thiamine-phosphate synthase enzyme YjbQ [Chloroflexi bacterium]|nr:secondary thiamine-phosphate synthase enzyme YjbQ [Chloroflexota bacterium]